MNLIKGKLYRRYVNDQYNSEWIPLLNEPYNGQNNEFIKVLAEIHHGTIVMFLDSMIVEYRVSGGKRAGFTEEPWNLVLHGELIGWIHGKLEDIEKR